MRFFALLFNIYILVLACMPCRDRDEACAAETKTVFSQSSKHAHDEEPEHCTPFCICACCGQQATTGISLPAPVKQFIPFPEKKTAQYTQPLLAGLPGKVFQPPKWSV